MKKSNTCFTRCCIHGSVVEGMKDKQSVEVSAWAVCVCVPAVYLRVDSLYVGVQVALLGEGGRAEHAEVWLLPSMPDHVGLQNHLLVEGLPTVGANVGSLACREETDTRKQTQ